MKTTNTLNHAHPSKMEARYIDEIRKMTPQQRFDKLMAIIEKSNEWKKKYEYFQLAKDVNEHSIIVSET